MGVYATPPTATGPSGTGAVIFDDSVAGAKKNIRSDRTNQSPVDPLGEGITNFGSKTGVSAGATGDFATIGGGVDHVASGFCATVAGGESNICSGSSGFVAGRENTVSGGYGTAIGRGHVGQADYTVNFGFSCTSTALYGIACGNACQATAEAGVALGAECIAAGIQSVALGYSCHCTAAAPGAVAMGYDCTANNQRSVAMGDRCTTNGNNSVAMGRQCSTTGPEAVALGAATTAAEAAFAVGVVCHAAGVASVAMGRGAKATREGQFAFSANDMAGAEFSDIGQQQASFLTAVARTAGSAANESVDLKYGLNNNRNLNLDLNRTYGIEIHAVATKSNIGAGTPESAYYKVRLLARRGPSGNASIVAQQSETTLADAGLTWTFTVTAPGTDIIMTFSTGAGTTARVIVQATVLFTEIARN